MAYFCGCCICAINRD